MTDRLQQVCAFFDQVDDQGVSNAQKVAEHQKILRRIDTTSKSQSVEAVAGEDAASGAVAVDEFGNTVELPSGVVVEDGKLIGFGIHIYNEDVYPLQSFEIYLRNCQLTGVLDLDDCEDLVFLDVYHNCITEVKGRNLPSMRIFGVQDNQLEYIDAAQMPAVQGIDAGMNRLTSIDVSQNPELVELYINGNRFTKIDLSANPKLKYFYCHNNAITELDTRQNPLLRHLNATGNPLRSIRCLAPQREDALPLELYAGEGGTVGLKFNPVYDAQWKETGEWQQSYYAYPEMGFAFIGWYDEAGQVASTDATWVDGYGTSRVLTAKFRPASELIDVYDRNRQRTGIVMERAGASLPEGQYWLNVLAVVQDMQGRYLITQRSQKKSWAAGWWEVPGGGVAAGETSASTVLREVEEEVGLNVDGYEPELINSYCSENAKNGHNYFVDIYRFQLDFTGADVTIQTAEAVDFRLATWEEIEALHEEGIFLHFERLKTALGK